MHTTHLHLRHCLLVWRRHVRRSRLHFKTWKRCHTSVQMQSCWWTYIHQYTASLNNSRRNFLPRKDYTTGNHPKTQASPPYQKEIQIYSFKSEIWVYGSLPHPKQHGQKRVDSKFRNWVGIRASYYRKVCLCVCVCVYWNVPFVLNLTSQKFTHLAYRASSYIINV